MEKNDDEFSVDQIINTLAAIQKFDSSRANIRMGCNIYEHFIGSIGTIVLISNINKHGFNSVEYKSAEEDPDVYLIGENNCEITLQHILNVLEKMKKQKFEMGRTYAFEGIQQHSAGVYELMWGS